tara:strand:- start:87509 stop:88018 length:510 start_codon:yes stop_codon:yes gene_type:complete
MKTIFSFIFIVGLNFSCFSQTKVAEHILSLDSLTDAPTATINDVAWIAGLWKGEAFGGVTEENWSAPSNGSMMAAFKVSAEGKVLFYELEIIRELEGSLILQLKHFNGDLKGWETKDETVDFPLVKITENTVYFDGMTFDKISENEMNVYVLMHAKDGTTSEMKFNYKK